MNVLRLEPLCHPISHFKVHHHLEQYGAFLNGYLCHCCTYECSLNLYFLVKYKIIIDKKYNKEKSF